MADYCDYSQVLSLDEAVKLSTPRVNPTNGEDSLAMPMTKAYMSSSADANFPTRLHYVLSETEKDGLSYIVSWQPHGRSFTVHKPVEFVDQVLRQWFSQSKFTSFQRQLNIYGFTRITSGPDRNGYYHERFLRGKIFLTYGLPRMCVKGNRAHRPTTDRNEQPNFYAMRFLPSSDSPPSAAPVVASIGTTHSGVLGVATADDLPRPTMGVMKEEDGTTPSVMHNVGHTASLLSLVQRTLSRPSSFGSVDLVVPSPAMMSLLSANGGSSTLYSTPPEQLSQSTTAVLPQYTSSPSMAANNRFMGHPTLGVQPGPHPGSTLSSLVLGIDVDRVHRQVNPTDELMAAEYVVAHQRRRQQQQQQQQQSRIALAILAAESMSDVASSPSNTDMLLRHWYHNNHHPSGNSGT